MRGRAARQAIDPESLIVYINDHASTATSGSPRRTRKLINGIPITTNDNRTLRRWASGSIEGVTLAAAEAFLHRYELTLTGNVTYLRNYSTGRHT